MEKPQVIICFAFSKDGYYKPDNGKFVPSPEDQAAFADLMSQEDAALLGANTLRENEETITKNLRPGFLRLGLTHHPDEFKTIRRAGLLEIKNMSAVDGLNYLISHGKKKIIVLSGSPADELLKARRVTEAQITVEPVWLHEGLSLENWELTPKILREGYPKQLNDQGTMLYHYDL